MADMHGYERGATFSPDSLLRYSLWRVWEPAQPRLLWAMFNPSTADADTDDPTIAHITHITRANGYGGLEVVNLLPVRSPSPEVARMWLRTRGNEAAIDGNFLHVTERAKVAGAVVAAWGQLGASEPHMQAAMVAALARWRANLLCVGTTGTGAPLHPLARGRLRVPADVQLQEWVQV